MCRTQFNSDCLFCIVTSFKRQECEKDLEWRRIVATKRCRKIRTKTRTAFVPSFFVEQSKMPKVKRSRKPPPDGWELIEPTLDELDQKMREGKSDCPDVTTTLCRRATARSLCYWEISPSSLRVVRRCWSLLRPPTITSIHFTANFFYWIVSWHFVKG